MILALQSRESEEIKIESKNERGNRQINFDNESDAGQNMDSSSRVIHLFAIKAIQEHRVHGEDMSATMKHRTNCKDQRSPMKFCNNFIASRRAH